MNTDLDHTTHSNIKINGQHIQFVSPFHIEDCLNRLNQIREASSLRKSSSTYVHIRALDERSAQFEISCRWASNHLIHVKAIKGKLTTQQDGTTRVAAAVPPMGYEVIHILLGLGAIFVIIFLAVGWGQILPFIGIFSFTILMFGLLIQAFHRPDTQYMHQLLLDVLYRETISAG